MGNCVLLGVLLYRQRARKFPIFTTLIAANVLRTIVNFFTHQYGTAEQYFYTYWTLAIGDMLLQLGVAYELASQVFRPLGAWAPDVRRSFLPMIGVSLLIAGALTWLAVPPTKTLRLTIVIRGDFFSSALMAELFVVMIALSVSLGLPWQSHASRIAQGYGLYSLLGIVTDGAHGIFGSLHGRVTYKLISQVEIGFYLVCLLYWIVTLSLKEPEPRKLPEQLHQDLRALQQRASDILGQLRVTGNAP